MKNYFLKQLIAISCFFLFNTLLFGQSLKLYLDIPSIQGYCTSSTFLNHHELLAFEYGASVPVDVVAIPPVGNFESGCIAFTRKTDKATPIMLQKLANGQKIDNGPITFKFSLTTQTGPVIVSEIELCEAYFKDYSTGFIDGDSYREENFSIAFTRIKITQWDSGNPQDPPTVFCWDIALNAPGSCCN